jgi:hypothetical protein
LRSSGLLRSAEWQFCTYVPGQPVGPIFKVKKPKNNASFFLDFLTLEEETERLTRNVGTELQLSAAKYRRTVQMPNMFVIGI